MLKSYKCYQDVLDTLLEGCQIISPDWRYLYLNDAAARHSSKTKKELLGSTMIEMYPGIQDTEMFVKLRDCMEKRTPHRTENEFTFPDGSKGSFDLIMEPVPEGVLIFSWNITEHKQTEKLLLEIINSSPVGIYIIQDRRFRLVNSTFQKGVGYTESELSDIYPFEIVHPEDREMVRENAVKMLKGERVSPYEYRYLCKSGESNWAAEQLTSIQFQGKRATLGNFMDITGRKLAEEKLGRSYERLQRAMDATIQTIALIVETRDPYTSGHQQRVARLASAIAEEMRLPKEQIETIRMSGLLHDIGKIYVPAEILSKPGRLSDPEMNMIKTHPQVGSDILKTLELPWRICPMVLQHHERMDGSGYPSGLTGEDIILESRILAVADVVEATASHRPYRPALGIDKALEEIWQNKGLLYDSRVVDACIELFSEKRFDL
ncbi:MAG: Metal dependent phosphohydrolase with a response regulator receiver domain protein [bacterium]|nr:MAG: Metal dependent phosphohydrolase with a response regulator receiver domain protein [bacterium]